MLELPGRFEPFCFCHHRNWYTSVLFSNLDEEIVRTIAHFMVVLKLVEEFKCRQRRGNLGQAFLEIIRSLIAQWILSGTKSMDE
jgi:hypothetical protein